MTSASDLLPSRTEVAVVGGGVAGLAAAALVARAGRPVVLLERSPRLGGRAETQTKDGVRLNLGPHALYCRGDAFRLLRELEVPFTGRFPSPGRSLLFADGAEHELPSSLGALLRASFLSWREKLRLARLLRSLPRIGTRPLDPVPLASWIRGTAGDGALAELLRTLFRLSTYSDDPARMSAGAAIDQLRAAVEGNVWYVDGGWQTLADGLRDSAARAGAVVVTGARAESVTPGEGGVEVALAGGRRLAARVAVIAADPAEAERLLGLPGRWTEPGLHPVRAACLDVALLGLPRPERRFAVGLGRPWYASVHSAAARLAPEGVAVVHVLKYLGATAGEPVGSVEAELEGVLERLQPGWRAQVASRRFLPSLTVAHALPLAATGGLAGRAGVAVDERPGVFLAGDWVGSRGLLADASAASAREAARRAVEVAARSGAAGREVARADA